MPTLQFFEVLAADFGRGVHDFRASGDTLKAYLTNQEPDAALHQVKDDLAEIPAGYGYPAGGVETQNDYVVAGHVGQCTGVGFSITAEGGSVGPFQYLVLYNASPLVPANPLIGWWTYPTPLTLRESAQLLVTFGYGMFSVVA